MASPGSSPLDVAKVAGWWNLLLPVFGGTLWAQFYISQLPQIEFEQIKSRLVTRVLGAACRSVVYPRSLEQTHIRAIVSLIDDRKQKRFARYSFNAEPDPERQGEWPIEFDVTGEAILGKQVVLRELPRTHHRKYDKDVQRAVLEDVCTILAAPLLDPDNRRGRPLGVVAFDSIMNIEQLGFTSREMRHVAQSWADVIAIILTQKDISEEIQGWEK